MGLFITVSIAERACLGLDACGSCITKCPVNIFAKGGSLPTVDGENEDECTLCNLCIDVCNPNCILIKKEYE
jgi:NAD-dependent dihydropyrimidine dehydrogenase PreA subunit